MKKNPVLFNTKQRWWSECIYEKLQHKKIKWESFLGIKIANKLNFDNQIDKKCKQAGQKFNALSMLTLS